MPSQSWSSVHDWEHWPLGCRSAVSTGDLWDTVILPYDVPGKWSRWQDWRIYRTLTDVV